MNVLASRARMGKALLMGLLFALFGLFAVHRITNTDLFFHIRCGLDILTQGKIIIENIYAYTAPGYQFSNHAWLSKVVFALVYKSFSFVGLSFFGTLLITLAFLPIFNYVFKARWFSYYYLLAILGIGLMSCRFQIRPQLFSFIFFSVYLTILMRVMRHKKYALLLCIVPLQIIWNQMHAYSLLGVFLVGAFAVDTLIVQGERKERCYLGALLCVCVLSYLCMYRLDLFIGMWIKIFSGYKQFVFGSIVEFWPMDMTLQFCLFVLLSFPLFVGMKRRGSIARMIIYHVLLLWTISVSRNVGYLTIATLLMIGERLCFDADVLKKKIFAGSGKMLALCNALFLIAALVATLCWGVWAAMRVTGVGIDSTEISTRTAEFLQEVDIAGNGYNEFAYGSYLLFARPQKKVFIHNQGEAYPPELFNGFAKAYDDPQVFQWFLTRYAITHITLKYRVLGYSLMRWLFTSKVWKVIYCDGDHIVFVKTATGNQSVLDVYAIKDKEAAVSIDQLKEKLALFASREMPSLLKKVFTDPSSEFVKRDEESLLMFQKANILADLGYFNSSEEALITCLEKAPYNREIITRLVTLYELMKDDVKHAMTREYALSHNVSIEDKS